MNSELAIASIEELEAEAPAALRLARLASIAVRVERHLLRRLRLELLPGADVGSEADLWFSAVVESRGSGSFVLDAAVALRLRRDLAGESALFERAAGITEAEHRHMPASIRLEEQLHAIAARGGNDVLARLDEALAPALRSLREGGARAKELARWAMRALPRFDPIVHQSGAAVTLMLGASVLLGGRRIVRGRMSSRAPFNQLTWALPAAALLQRVRIAVEVTQGAVHFVAASGDAPTLDLPRTTPCLVEASWASGEARTVHLVEAEAGNSLAIDAGVQAITLRALDGSEYLLRMHAAAPPRSTAPAQPSRPVCFVTMGFGKKNDFETGRVLDLDQSYQFLIQPAVEASGLTCVRADNVVSEVINPAVNEYLLKADLVLADLSTSNNSALYELGLRHALRPYGTLVISEEGFIKSSSSSSSSSSSFMFHDLVIRTYRHLGEDISHAEARRFTAELAGVIKETMAKAAERRPDSPVYQSPSAPVPPVIDSEGKVTPPGITDGNDAEKWRDVCFILAPMGKKTDFETGRVLDFEVSYRNLIKPAVHEAGLRCVRLDEIETPGLIAPLLYEYLLKSSVVIADLSTSNRHVIYQLGIRHGLRPQTTILLAQDRPTSNSFLPENIPVIVYRHLGDDVGDEEAKRVQKILRQRLSAAASSPQPDSPVYMFPVSSALPMFSRDPIDSRSP